MLWSYPNNARRARHVVYVVNSTYQIGAHVAIAVIGAHVATAADGGATRDTKVPVAASQSVSNGRDSSTLLQ